MSKISRGDKGEKLVSQKLKKIKEYHKVINDAMYVSGKGEMSHQIDHILIHAHGVFVIETKNYYGTIITNTGESYWLKVFNNERVKISNPLKQNKSHAIVVEKLLKKKYEVIPVVVFVKNNAPYLGDENIINLKDLLLFIDSYPYQRELDEKDIKDIYRILKDNQSDVSKKEHVETIGYLKQMQEEFRQEMSFAIENGKCPRCGGKIVEKDLTFKCVKCNFKFNLKQ